MIQLNLPMRNFRNKIKMCYCLGWTNKTIKVNPNQESKLRNKFDPDIYAYHENYRAQNWSLQLKWHRINITTCLPSRTIPKSYCQVGT